MSIERSPEQVYKHILRYAQLPTITKTSQRLEQTTRLWEERLLNRGYNTSLIDKEDYRRVYQALAKNNFDNLITYEHACKNNDYTIVKLLSEYVDLPDEERCVSETTDSSIINSISLSLSIANSVLLKSLDNPVKVNTLLNKYTPDEVLEQALLIPNITNNQEESIALLIAYASEDVIEPLAHLAHTHKLARAFEEQGHYYDYRDAMELNLVKSLTHWLDTLPSIRVVQSVLEELIIKYPNSVQLVEAIISTATFPLDSYLMIASRYKRGDMCSVFARYGVDTTKAITLAIRQGDLNTIQYLKSYSKPEHKRLAKQLGSIKIYNALL